MPGEPVLDVKLARPGKQGVRFGKSGPEPVLVSRRHDQMDMIGYQALSPELRAGALRHRDQTAVKPIIRGSAEHRFAAIAALGDMVR